MARDNQEIRRDIKENLQWDARVDADHVDVEVDNGTVTLAGEVPTYTARWAAEGDAALILGVTNIENNIKVSLPSSVQIPEDDEIEMRIRDFIMLNPDLLLKDIIVESKGGEVVLSGNVDAYWKKVEAEDTAYNVVGVWNVINQLTIVPTDSTDDKIIGDEIMRALTRIVTVDESVVDVKVEDGIVTLAGDVSGWDAFNDAHDAARFTSGVRGVENNLTVQPAVV